MHNEYAEAASLHGIKVDRMLDDLNATQPDPKDLAEMAIEDEAVHKVLREAQERKRASVGK